MAAFLAVCLAAFLAAWFLACLAAILVAWLVAYLPTFLAACLAAFMAAWLQRTPLDAEDPLWSVRYEECICFGLGLRTPLE